MTQDQLIWNDDLLGFSEIASTFTKLVQSLSAEEQGAKVISIEAGFGRGKTFFRENWARSLRAAGEVVVEIDARQSDHSGDPVVTFIGALVGALGKDEETGLDKAKRAGLKYSGVAARVIAKAVLRQGAEDLIEAVEGRISGNDDSEILKSAVEGFGNGMSKLAGELIAAQLGAEKARKEMPAQLDALRLALTGGDTAGRVVVLIDELDRCHPDYAITLLEAMKLVFDRPGYVFVLMVNSEHLERVAAHRFVGWHKEEQDRTAQEPYLEKFVDMRLKLPTPVEKIGEAAGALALRLPEPEEPFGEGEEFTVARAAQVAAELAPISGLSMRQIKRILLRVELAVRSYQGTPVDLPLLVWLAFYGVVGNWLFAPYSALPRSELSPGVASKWQKLLRETTSAGGRLRYEQQEFVRKLESRIVEVAKKRHRLGAPPSDYRWPDEHMVIAGLAPWYIPEHQAMLDAVHQLVAD